VPSLLHESLVELFRNRGELAAELLERHAQISFAHDRVENASIDLTQVVPTEFRADAVVELRDASEATVAAIIVEVQLNIDREKEYSWPAYVPLLRARLRCPVVLLVLAPDPAVARWARASIPLGHPGFNLAPVVIELAEVPRVTDPTDAARLPELAVLSTLGHPELEIARVAFGAIQGLTDDHKRLYWDVIRAALPPAVRTALEAHMQRGSDIYMSDFAISYYDQGLDKGLEQGHEEGLEKGLEQGAMRGLRSAVLALMRAKLGTIAPQDLAAVEAIHEERTLTELIVTLGRATTKAGVRAALAASRRPR
jgi:hypothetical protein